MPQVRPPYENFARIKVVGVGGSGGNVVTYMAGSRVRNVELLAMNTDAQDLHATQAHGKLRIGKDLTRGLGAGMDPAIGKKAAEESRDEIEQTLKDADMVFITGGLGGGTCSGAAPVVAEIAKKLGALTIGVVTMPFQFEGRQRSRIAQDAWNELYKNVDSLVTIENDRLMDLVDRKTSLLHAFRTANDILRNAVSGISDIVTVPGLINVDFADMRSVMADSGVALLAMGRAVGEGKAIQAAKMAVATPLVDASMQGARGILFTVTGSKGLGMQDVNEIAKVITESADPEAKIIFGAVNDKSLRKNEVRITVIATGLMEREKEAQAESAHPQITQEAEIFHEKPSEQVERIRVIREQEEEEDPFEVPSFLRRKLN